MNEFNDSLTQAIESYISNEKSGLNHATLLEAYAVLRDTYAELKKEIGVSQSNPLIAGYQQRLAYILSRMPATAAVISRIFSEIEPMLPLTSFKSILDLGSGTGAVLWAALNANLLPKKVTAIDHDSSIIQLAQDLSAFNKNPFWRLVQWQLGSLSQTIDVSSHDLVTLSYVLIEQSAESIKLILEKSWDLSNQALLIVEPGTPKGFQNILLARQYFIEKGGFIAAPCTHMGLCPLRDNWCHFNERITRTYWQRKMKNAVLGYEDEPYSYLFVTKQPIARQGERILFSPKKKSGHVILEVCAPDSMKKVTVTRSMKAQYKSAKKKEAGELLC